MADSLKVLSRAVLTPDGSTIPKVDTGLVNAVITPSQSLWTVVRETVTTSQSILDVFNVMPSGEGSLGYILIISDSDNTVPIYVGFADVSTDRDASPIRVRPGQFALFDIYGASQISAKTQSSTATITSYLFHTS